MFDDGNGMLCCSMMRWRLMRTLLCVYISGAWLGGRDGEILWLWALGRYFFVGDWRMILVVVLCGFCFSFAFRRNVRGKCVVIVYGRSLYVGKIVFGRARDNFSRGDRWVMMEDG